DEVPDVVLRILILTLSTVAAAFHLYTAGFTPFTALVQRPIHLALMAVLGFLGVGVMTGTGGRWMEQSPLGKVVSAALAVGMAASCLYLAVQQEALVGRIGSPSTLDLALGGIAILALLELTRRTTGWALVVIAVGALTYAIAGPYLPGILAHRGYQPSRLIQQLYLSTEG